MAFGHGKGRLASGSRRLVVPSSTSHSHLLNLCKENEYYSTHGGVVELLHMKCNDCLGLLGVSPLPSCELPIMHTGLLGIRAGHTPTSPQHSTPSEFSASCLSLDFALT